MLRRVVSAILLPVGGVPLVWGLRVLEADPARGAVITCVAAIGLLLSLTGLARSRLWLPAWLRWLGGGVTVVVGLAVLLAWRHLTGRTLADVGDNAPLVLRRELGMIATNLLWLAGTLLYVLAAIAALPPRAAPPSPVVDRHSPAA